MKHISIIGLLLFLFFNIIGCQPKQSDNTPSTSAVTPLPTEQLQQQGTGKPPQNKQRDANVPESMVFIKGKFSIQDAPVKLEGAKDLISGKDIDIYYYPNSKATVEVDGETASNQITLTDKSNMAFSIQLKKPYTTYKTIQKLTLEIPEYESIIFTNLDLTQGGSIDLGNITFKKKAKG